MTDMNTLYLGDGTHRLVLFHKISPVSDATFESIHESFLSYCPVADIQSCPVSSNRDISAVKSSRSQISTLLRHEKTESYYRFRPGWLLLSKRGYSDRSQSSRTVCRYDPGAGIITHYGFSNMSSSAIREKLEGYQATMHTERKKTSDYRLILPARLQMEFDHEQLARHGSASGMKISQTCFHSIWHAMTIFCVVGAKGAICFVLIHIYQAREGDALRWKLRKPGSTPDEHSQCQTRCW